MPRITLLTTGLAIGGAEAQVVLLACTLKERGWNVHVVSMLAPEAHQEALAAAGIPVHSLGMRRGVPDPRAVVALRRHLKRFRPDVVHSHMIHANLLARAARLVAPIPALVCTAHSVWEGSRWRDWAYRWTDFLCDAATNVSASGLRRYVREKLFSPGKAVLIPNGIDADRFAPQPELRLEYRSRLGWEDKFVWLAVGNLREPKDYPNMLGAFRLVASAEENCVLAIVGSGPLEPQIREQIRQLGLPERVTLLGCRTDVRELLQAADAYVLSSAWEGTPMALLEAAASGLPAVATRVGGNEEAIRPKETGLLTPPADSEALAAAMIELMSMPGHCREQMGHAARSHVLRCYSHHQIVSQWENLYKQLLESAPVARAGAKSKTAKRMLDLILAGSALVLLLPLLALIGLAVRFSSEGPVLFRQDRLGKDGVPFRIMKFRTMRQNAPDVRNSDGSAHSSDSDPRVTALGRLLRRTSLDELPQLWNVVCGEMSLVGPRPDQLDQLRYYSAAERRKLAVRPGITGLAQIRGRNSIPWETRKQLDCEYVERWSLALDLSILFKTIPYVLLGRDIHEEPDASHDNARRYVPTKEFRN
jgi:lipopolysaccharide/colanic/teichoic acid biosynthesis glycosyltransferase